MALDIAKMDEHIQALREGNTLTENEVKALCEKVRPGMTAGAACVTCFRLLFLDRQSPDLSHDGGLPFGTGTSWVCHCS